jgi:multisubunit Na+/H+ antiporter MnhC subunit
VIGAHPSENVRVVSALMVPFVLVFGVYVIAHGHYGPGGGFAGGVVLAVAVVLAGSPLDASWSRVLPGVVADLHDGRRHGPVLRCGPASRPGRGEVLDYGAVGPEGMEPAQRRYLGIMVVEVGVGAVVFGGIVMIFDRLAALAAEEAEPMIELLADRYIYLFVVALLSLGLFTLLVERHLVKKLVGLVLFQTAVFLFFIEGSVKDGDVPVIDPAIGSDPDAYVNPLPHLLILTALVVGVAVIGVALALIVTIHRAYGTLDDVELSLAAAETDDRHPGEHPMTGRLLPALLPVVPTWRPPCGGGRCRAPGRRHGRSLSPSASCSTVLAGWGLARSMDDGPARHPHGRVGGTGRHRVRARPTRRLRGGADHGVIGLLVFVYPTCGSASPIELARGVFLHALVLLLLGAAARRGRGRRPLQPVRQPRDLLDRVVRADRARGPAAAVASFRYLLIGTVGSSLYLLGVGFLYFTTGRWGWIRSPIARGAHRIAHDWRRPPPSS